MALIGAACLSILKQPYFIGLYGDDACYLLQAMGFTNSGLCPNCSWNLESIPYARGWSLVLVPFVYLLGDHYESYRVISGTLTVLAVILVCDLCRRVYGYLVAVLLGGVLLTSEGILVHGTTLMAEPLYLALISGLLWLDCRSRSTLGEGVGEGGVGRQIGKGLLAGWCACTRAEGMVVVVALAVDTLVRRRWREFALQLGTASMVWVAVRVLWPLKMVYAKESQLGFGGLDNLLAYLWAWSMNQAMQLGMNLFLAPSWIERGVGGTLTALVVLAVLRQRRLRLEHWLLLGTAMALFLWPYYTPRYWTGLLPVWLFCALSGLPRRAQVGLLCALLTAQVISLGSRERLSSVQETNAKVELWNRLDKTGPEEVVATPFPCRAHLWSHRSWTTFSGADSLGALTRNLLVQGADIVVWERQNNLIRGAQGQTLFPTPPSLDLWLERSTLYEVVYSNQAGVIARLKVPREQLDAAFVEWQEAFSKPQAGERLPALEHALRLVPDFPELRVLWFVTAAEVPGFSPQRVEQAITSYVGQYPHDFEVGAMGLSILRRLGRDEAANQVAALCLAEARRLGDARAETAFR